MGPRFPTWKIRGPTEENLVVKIVVRVGIAATLASRVIIEYLRELYRRLPAGTTLFFVPKGLHASRSIATV